MATSDNIAPEATYTFTLSATIDGHTGPLAIQAASINELRRAVRLLNANNVLAATVPKEWSFTPSGEPICPKHGVPMRKRARQGDTWFSHNVGTADAPWYCRGYAGKDSPGYDV